MKTYGRDHPDFPHPPLDWGGGPVRLADGHHGERIAFGRGVPIWNWACRDGSEVVAYEPAPDAEAMDVAYERARTAIELLPAGTIPTDALATIMEAVHALRARATVERIRARADGRTRGRARP